jgi:hypothetical protein
LPFGVPTGSQFVSKVGGGIALALLIWLPTRKRRIRNYFALAGLIITTLAVTSCGSNQPQFIPITISATSGAITHTVSVDLTVK